MYFQLQDTKVSKASCGCTQKECMVMKIVKYFSNSSCFPSTTVNVICTTLQKTLGKWSKVLWIRQAHLMTLISHMIISCIGFWWLVGGSARLMEQLLTVIYRLIFKVPDNFRYRIIWVLMPVNYVYSFHSGWWCSTWLLPKLQRRRQPSFLKC
jgi:hypothetical protein